MRPVHSVQQGPQQPLMPAMKAFASLPKLPMPCMLKVQAASGGQSQQQPISRGRSQHTPASCCNITDPQLAADQQPAMQTSTLKIPSDRMRRTCHDHARRPSPRACCPLHCGHRARDACAAALHPPPHGAALQAAGSLGCQVQAAHPLADPLGQCCCLAVMPAACAPCVLFRAA